MKSPRNVSFNAYKFANHDNSNFISLLLQKAVYPSEYMDTQENIKGTSLPEKEDFYNHLNMEDIADADYVHAKTVCQDSEIKNLGEYRDLYVQGNALLLADIFENFRNMFLKIYELDSEKFLLATGLAWQAALKHQSKIRSFK